jgi:alpha-glucoside transport system substrate-binding protein
MEQCQSQNRKRFRNGGEIMTRLLRVLPAVAPLAVGALVLSACGGSTESGAASSGEAGAAPDVDCAAFEQYGDLSGSTVTFYTSVVAPDDAPYIAAFEPFEQCTRHGRL